MHHSFDIKIASAHGVNVAIFLNHMFFWIEKNIANNKHNHKGRFWTYNSQEALVKIFPYWSRQTLRTTINYCLENDLIIKDNFNDMKYDRTNWYSLTDNGMNLFDNISNNPRIMGKCIGENQPIDRMKSTNRSDEINPPIPDINTDNKTYIKAKEKQAKEKKLNRKERDSFVGEERLILPDWIKEETWSEFLQYRKSIKSPMSIFAQKKAINKLTQMKREGENIDEVIDNTIINGWKGFFSIKKKKEFKNGNGIRKGNENVNGLSGESRDLQQEAIAHTKKRWTTEQREILERGAGVRWNESTARYERTVPAKAKCDVSDSSRHDDRLQYLDSTITPFLGLFGD